LKLLGKEIQNMTQARGLGAINFSEGAAIAGDRGEALVLYIEDLGKHSASGAKLVGVEGGVAAFCALPVIVLHRSDLLGGVNARFQSIWMYFAAHALFPFYTFRNHNKENAFMRYFIFSILFIAVSLSNPLSAQPEAQAQKAVLITGASTGIGRSMAELMASEGHFVYAGARKDKDMAELNAIENIQAIRLDVTDQAQIDAAVKTIEAEGRGLYGLINNAGVGVIYPLIEVPESEFDFQMDVNLYGPYRVTKAFAPLIIESKGRISTTGSISGILSGPLFGVYSMSKHAMEAFVDSLAAEMERFDVKVSIIEPGNFESKIGDTLVKRMKSRGFDSQNSLYKEDFDRMMAYMDGERESEADPIAVSKAAMHAMFDDNPKRRYMVVPNQREADITIRKAIEEVVQLNQGQEYSYTRDELVKMLEESMAAHP
jgi:NAD(P)-dependent dehydrogenase (short-subunit alcohol dehydrogenase family)